MEIFCIFKKTFMDLFQRLIIMDVTYPPNKTVVVRDRFRECKKTGKMIKCHNFKKEVFANAKITLNKCDSLAEFNSRTYLQETLCR